MNKRLQNIIGILGIGAAIVGLPTIGHATENAGICARVKVQLNQSVAITRTAFRATLTIGNSPANVPLDNVKVTLDIRDPNNLPANALFGISVPVLTDLTVDGTGNLAPGLQGSAVWTMLPTRDAAPVADTVYTVGGTIAYTQGGVNVSLPLFPAPITVVPDPLLDFHYFWQHTVYGDDPFTPQVEPSEPFYLGLLAVNNGHGTAHNLTITSSNPQIVDNQKGLLINFQLIGAAVNGKPVAPTLQVDLGDIVPGDTAVADWALLSSLEGKFISYSASFEHVDDLGNPRTSIIDGVDVHPLEHIVRALDTTGTGKPDFLAIDDPNSDDLPSTLWLNTGATATVNSMTNAQGDTPVGGPIIVTGGPITNANLTAQLTVPATSGAVYIRTDDPGNGVFQLVSVVRSDGKVVRLGDNVWETHRIERLLGQAPYPQNRLYLFDVNTPGTYTLNYQATGPVPPTVGLGTVSNGGTYGPGQLIVLTANTMSTQTTVNEVDYYIDGVLAGSSTVAPFSITIQPLPGAHTIKAVAIDANGNIGSSTTDSIVVNSNVNEPPVVTLTSPTNGALLTAPAGLTVSANASDADGNVTEVDFYQNGVFIGSSVAPPYTLPVANLMPGIYSFTSAAIDNAGAKTTSLPTVVTVQAPLTQSGLPIVRAVSAVREPAAGQMMVTVENDGTMNAVNVALVVAHTKWGTLMPLSIVPSTVAMLTPNSQTTFTLQFASSPITKFVMLSGVQTGRSFSSFTRVTP